MKNIKYSKFIIFVVLMLVANLFVMNNAVSLWDEDEAAYAGFGTEMLQTEDWVNPQFVYSTIHRKTPFHFWTIATSFQLFGMNEFALRLPSSLAILLTCFFVFALGKPIFGHKNALRAAVILSSSVVLPLMAKIAFTDATLLACSTLAVLSLFNYIQSPSWRWNLGLWGAISIGVLVKGPPIIILLGGIWLLLALLHPKRKNLIGTHPWFWGLLALLPFGAWVYSSYLADYQSWQNQATNIPFEQWWNQSFEDKKIHLLPFLWDWYVLRRIGGAVLGQSGFWGYHLVVLTVAFLTWLPLWFATLKDLFKKPNPKELLLLIWVVIGWFFWEFMSSKLPSYSMAAQPALALLLALQIEKLEKKETWSFWHKFGFGFYLFIFIVLIIMIPIAAYYLFGQMTLFYSLPMSIILSFLIFRLIKYRKIPLQFFKNLTIFGLAFMFLLWVCVAPLIEQSPIKALDDVVEKAYEMTNKNKDARFILTGLNAKQLKISLFVYGQQKFGKIEELYTEEAVAAYQNTTKTVLVIGCDQLEEFRTKFKENNMAFEPQKIVYWSTDDQLKEHNFYLVVN